MSIEDAAPEALARSPEEALAYFDGQIAMMALSRQPKDRLRHLMALRRAARIDPTSAYNLGNLLVEAADDGKFRPRRRATAISCYASATSLGLARLKDPAAPFAKAPPIEEELRNLISCALTNIGSGVSNAGDPAKAIDYFERAIKVYDRNWNANVCAGNMSVWHHEETGLDPLQGIKHWEQASKLEMNANEPPEGADYRSRLVAVARQIEKQYGAEQARRWIKRRSSIAQRPNHAFECDFVLKDPADISRTGRRIQPAAVAAGYQLAQGFLGLRDMRLEMKVTIAGSLLASLCRIDTPTGAGRPGILDDAIEALQAIEPLDPFLGDDEWQDLGPAETAYLTEADMRDALCSCIDDILVLLRINHPDLSSRDAAIGLLFNLDTEFRHGVCSMARGAIESSRSPFCFIPATFVGGGRRH